MSAPVVLDLGAGSVPRAPGAIRADIARSVRPDVVLDASRTLPFRSGTLDAIHCYDLVEHIEDISALVAELHRVLVPGGTFHLTTPHFSSANSFTDPTHRHHFGWFSFDYFTEGHELKYYSTARFRLRERILRFHGGLVDGVIRRLANRYPGFYERRLTWLFPAWYLDLTLEAIK